MIASWTAARQTTAELRVEVSAFAVVCRRSLTSDGLATAWADQDCRGPGMMGRQAGTGRTTLVIVFQ